MPAKRTSGGISAAEVEAKLPRTFFVMRGHVADAFGLTRHEIRTLVEDGIFRAEYPFGKRRRARFVRTQILQVARKWETERSIFQRTTSD